MRRLRAVGGLTVTLLAWWLTPTASADDAPWELVDWVPAAEKPVFQGEGGDAWDRKIRERGFILREGATYHLWYTGYNEAKSPLRMLGHATSTDGLAWTRDPANPVYRASWTEDVHVGRDGGQYLMVAEGKNDQAHQLASPDGVHWAELGPLDVRKTDGRPISPGPYGTPVLWAEGGKYSLLYERGDQGVWLATSTDRQVWTNVQDTPVLKAGPEAYDRAAVAFNQVVKRGGFYYAFYHANDRRPWGDWTSDVARSRDLTHWEKYPGNPVVRGNCSSPVLVDTPDGDRLYTMHPEVRVFRPAAKLARR